MQRRRAKVDRYNVEHRNFMHKDRINWMRSYVQKIDADTEKKVRLDDALCPVCHYEKSRIGGAACTSAQCAFCQTVLHCGNTNIDVMCKDCAKQAGLCRHCGADLNLKNRRKLVLPEVQELNEGVECD